MLSRKESLDYIRNVLLIDTTEDEIKKDKVEFLNKLLCAFHGAMPFQNVTLMSKPSCERHCPTLPEVKQQLLSGEGGLCFTANMSLYMILRSLDFDVFLNVSQVFPEPNKYIRPNHLILFVKNLKHEGDLYYVDGGAGHPSFQAVCLDFDVESPIYHDSYLRYKFIFMGDTVRRLMNRSVLFLSNDATSKPVQEREFEPLFDFKIALTTDVEKIREHMKIVFQDPEETPFHRRIIAVKFRNKKLILISNNKLALEADDGTVNIAILPDDKAIAAAFKEHFPELNESYVKKAIGNWRNL